MIPVPHANVFNFVSLNEKFTTHLLQTIKKD